MYMLNHRCTIFVNRKGVKVEEIDVEFGEDTQPTTKVLYNMFFA